MVDCMTYLTKCLPCTGLIRLNTGLIRLALALARVPECPKCNPSFATAFFRQSVHL